MEAFSTSIGGAETEEEAVECEGTGFVGPGLREEPSRTSGTV